MQTIDKTSVIYAYDFSFWKRSIVRRFFHNTKVRFVKDIKQVPSGSTLAVWGRKPVPEELEKNIRLLRLEDGFLRSVGLGAELIKPLSWVIDSRGIYFDATRPSDVEHLLATTEFSAELLSRAENLRNYIVANGLTKYNVGGSEWTKPNNNKRIILVPGQVESDASIKFGSPKLSTNISLLQTVRQNNPDAYVIYKPHPVVLAGLRLQGQGEEKACNWCDEIVNDVSITTLLPAIDEVHVLTSLAGFEALLRGKMVTCYGQPFYAGWGLTRDKEPIARRTRQLTLDELVAGVLILYPTYVSLFTKKIITPEEALEELLICNKKFSKKLSWWRKILRMCLKQATKWDNKNNISSRVPK